MTSLTKSYQYESHVISAETTPHQKRKRKRAKCGSKLHGSKHPHVKTTTKEYNAESRSEMTGQGTADSSST